MGVEISPDPECVLHLSQDKPSLTFFLPLFKRSLLYLVFPFFLLYLFGTRHDKQETHLRAGMSETEDKATPGGDTAHRRQGLSVKRNSGGKEEIICTVPWQA